MGRRAGGGNLVQTGADDLAPFVRELHDEIDERRIEELRLFDQHDMGVEFDRLLSSFTDATGSSCRTPKCVTTIASSLPLVERGLEHLPSSSPTTAAQEPDRSRSSPRTCCHRRP